MALDPSNNIWTSSAGVKWVNVPLDILLVTRDDAFGRSITLVLTTKYVTNKKKCGPIADTICNLKLALILWDLLISAFDSLTTEAYRSRRRLTCTH